MNLSGVVHQSIPRTASPYTSIRRGWRLTGCGLRVLLKRASAIVCKQSPPTRRLGAVWYLGIGKTLLIAAEYRWPVGPRPDSHGSELVCNALRWVDIAGGRRLNSAGAGNCVQVCLPRIEKP